jgi:hypothetical protein
MISQVLMLKRRRPLNMELTLWSVSFNSRAYSEMVVAINITYLGALPSLI